MSKTIAAMFKSYDQARIAKNKMLAQGINEDDLLVIADSDWDNEQPENSFDNDEMISKRPLGSMLGFLSPSTAYMQQFGPGDTNAAVGTAFPAGALLRAFDDDGLPDSHRKYYKSELKTGKALLKFNIPDGDDERIGHILHNLGSINVDSY